MISTTDITAMVGLYFWPFIRISAMLMAAPLFGAKSIVFSIHRLGLALLLTILVSPLLGPMPLIDPLSTKGLAVIFNQFLIGFAMGFILQLAMSALTMAGQSIAMTMGLGFAQSVDPVTGVSVPVIGKFYLVIGTLLFFMLNGHLVAIRILVESFNVLPVGTKGLGDSGFMELVLWGTKMYVGALLIALPSMVTLTIINISFGVMTRSAPQMNIFAVGFPTTLFAGVVIIMLTLPSLLPRFADLLMQAFTSIQRILVS